MIYDDSAKEMIGWRQHSVHCHRADTVLSTTDE